VKAGSDERISRCLPIQNVLFGWFDCPFGFDEDLQTEVVSDLGEVY